MVSKKNPTAQKIAREHQARDEALKRQAREAQEKRKEEMRKAARSTITTYTHMPLAALMGAQPNVHERCNRFFNYCEDGTPRNLYYRENKWTVGAAYRLANCPSRSAVPSIAQDSFDDYREYVVPDTGKRFDQEDAASPGALEDTPAALERAVSAAHVTPHFGYDLVFEGEFAEADCGPHGRTFIAPMEDMHDWMFEILARPLMVAAQILGEYEDAFEAPYDAELHDSSAEDTSCYGVSERFAASGRELGGMHLLPSVVKARARAAYMQMGMTAEQANAAIQLFLALPYDALFDALFEAQKWERPYDIGDAVCWADEDGNNKSVNLFTEEGRWGVFSDVIWEEFYPYLEDIAEETDAQTSLSMANMFRVMVYRGKQEGDVRSRVFQAVRYLLGELIEMWWSHRTPYDERVIA